MNQLIELTQTTSTMSSREIAELTGKEHKNVLADIRKMLEDLGATSAEFSADLLDSYGRTQPGFSLPKRECLILVSGYSVILRAKIIDRWQELEAQVQALAHQQTALLLENKDRTIQALCHQVANLAPTNTAVPGMYGPRHEGVLLRHEKDFTRAQVGEVLALFGTAYADCWLKLKDLQALRLKDRDWSQRGAQWLGKPEPHQYLMVRTRDVRGNLQPTKFISIAYVWTLGIDALIETLSDAADIADSLPLTV